MKIAARVMWYAVGLFAAAMLTLLAVAAWAGDGRFALLALIAGVAAVLAIIAGAILASQAEARDARNIIGGGR